MDNRTSSGLARYDEPPILAIRVVLYEAIVSANDLKIRLAKFALHLLGRDFMLGGWRDVTAAWLWFTIDDDQPSRRNQRLVHMDEDRMGIREFVISV